MGYNLPFNDVPGCISRDVMLESDELRDLMGRVVYERQGKGDAVGNLAATTLATNAYMYAGEEKYKVWVKGIC